MPHKFTSLLLFIAALALCLYELVYWVKHPELTQIQLFLKLWWVNAIAALTVALGFAFDNKAE